MNRNKVALAVAGAVLSLGAGQAWATNGLFMIGAGIRSQGMGGVGIAYGGDSLSAAANPANLPSVGMRGDIGLMVFNAEASAKSGTVAGAPPIQSQFGFDGEAQSLASTYLMPEMGMAMPLTDKLYAGFAVVPLGGGGTTYPYNYFSYSGNNTPQPDVPLGVELIVVQAPISVAYKINEDHTVGASLALNIARFRAFGLDAFSVFDGSVTAITAYPDNVSGKGYDWAFGAGVKLGWQGEFLDDRLALGLTYASKGYMTKFDKYKGIFPEQGRLNMPASYGMGVAFKPVKNFVFAVDAVRTLYSETGALGNKGPGTRCAAPAPAGPPCYGGTGPLTGLPSNGSTATGTPLELGNDDGMGFGWRDQTVYKVGVQYGLNERVLVRAGYNYGKSPVPNDQLTFSSLAPAISKHHWTVGFTYRASDNLEVTGAYMYSPEEKQESPLRQNVVGAMDVTMQQQMLGMSLSWVLDPADSLSAYGATPVSATPWGVYFGMGVGGSWNRNWDNPTLAAVIAEQGYTANAEAQPSSSISNMGWQFYGGYKISDFLAVEGGYVNFIDSYGRADVIGDPVYGQLFLSERTHAWKLGAVGSFPIWGDVRLIAKLGANAWNSRIKAINTTRAGGLLPEGLGETVFSREKKGTDIFYGVGLDWALADNFSLRLEAERFKVDGAYMDLVTGGFNFGF